MEKSPEAFRTISEVAEWLDVPTHVLRFWESRFAQVKPVKRAGGRRYYRPTDMQLIGGIKKLLHEDGMTIRAVQKLLREQGVKHVASFSKPLDFEEEASEVVEAVAVAAPVVEPLAPAPEPAPAAEPDPDPAPKVVQFGSVRRGEPELPFIGTAAEHATQEAPAPEEPPAAPPVRTIPPTPDVPVMDAEDDSAAHAAQPGIAARLIAMPGGLARNKARIAEAVAALRALRDGA